MALKNKFQKYRMAWEAMEADETVRETRHAIAQLKEEYEARVAGLQIKLDIFEGGYRALMDVEAAAIAIEVHAIAQTVRMEGVRAKYTKGRRTPRWKAIAMIWKPSQRLIDEHTTVSESKVTVEIMK